MPFPELTPSLPVWIRHLAAEYGDRTLIVLGERRLGYAEAEARSAHVARGLLAAGVGKGTRIAVLLPNGPDFVVAWLAAARVGALVVPMNTFYQARELGWVLRHADADTLICPERFLKHDYLARLLRVAPELADQRPPLTSTTLPFLRHVRVWRGQGPAWSSGGEAWLCAVADRTPAIDDALLRAVESEVTPADPMVVVYSSGSTADPKGAIHSHGSVIRHAYNLNAQRDLRGDDVIYSPMPFFWVGGFVFTLLSAMHLGARLVCEERFDPGATLELLERERVTIVAGWPHFGKALKAHPSFPDRDLSCIRAGNLYELLPGQAQLDPELRHNSLGMTETAGPHTFAPQEDPLPEKLRGSFGRSVPGLSHKIVDPESGERLGTDTLGEICVRGYSLAQGLYKREREEVFDPDGYYHTGDAGAFNAEGLLFFKGRLGDLIKTAGANVTPREVELVLETLPEVSQAHVVGVPHPERGENVAAAVVLAEGADTDAKHLRADLRQELSAYKVPRHFVFLEAAELPMTDTGKLDRRRLARLVAERVAEPA